MFEAGIEQPAQPSALVRFKGLGSTWPRRGFWNCLWLLEMHCQRKEPGGCLADTHCPWLGRTAKQALRWGEADGLTGPYVQGNMAGEGGWPDEPSLSAGTESMFGSASLLPSAREPEQTRLLSAAVGRCLSSCRSSSRPHARVRSDLSRKPCQPQEVMGIHSTRCATWCPCSSHSEQDRGAKSRHPRGFYCFPIVAGALRVTQVGGLQTVPAIVATCLHVSRTLVELAWTRASTHRAILWVRSSDGNSFVAPPGRSRTSSGRARRAVEVNSAPSHLAASSDRGGWRFTLTPCSAHASSTARRTEPWIAAANHPEESEHPSSRSPAARAIMHAAARGRREDAGEPGQSCSRARPALVSCRPRTKRPRDFTLRTPSSAVCTTPSMTAKKLLLAPSRTFPSASCSNTSLTSSGFCCSSAILCRTHAESCRRTGAGVRRVLERPPKRTGILTAVALPTFAAAFARGAPASMAFTGFAGGRPIGAAWTCAEGLPPPSPQVSRKASFTSPAYPGLSSLCLTRACLSYAATGGSGRRHQVLRRAETSPRKDPQAGAAGP